MAIFHPQKDVPVMTASRLQQYSLFLAGFKYDIRTIRNTVTLIVCRDCLYNREDTDLEQYSDKPLLRRGVGFCDCIVTSQASLTQTLQTSPQVTSAPAPYTIWWQQS